MKFLLMLLGVLSYGTVMSTASDTSTNSPASRDVLQELQLLRQLINQEKLFRMTLEGKLQEFQKVLQGLQQQQQQQQHQQQLGTDTNQQKVVEEMMQRKEESSALKLDSQLVDKSTFSVGDLSGQFAKLEAGLKKMESTVEKLNIRTSLNGERVAFSAGNAEATIRGIAFKRVFFSIGGGYHPDTGTFTAPMDGVYAFSWTVVVSHRKNCNTALFKNGDPVQINLSKAATVEEDLSGSQSVILELATNDVIQIHPYWICNKIRKLFSTFSGHKLWV